MPGYYEANVQPLKSSGVCGADEGTADEATDTDDSEVDEPVDEPNNEPTEGKLKKLYIFYNIKKQLLALMLDFTEFFNVELN